MVKMREVSNNLSFLMIVVVFCTISGCAANGKCRQMESSIKNAFIMYSQQKQNLDAPSEHWYQFIDSEIGREKFTVDLTHFVTTKYRVEAIYALG